jgi:hypothetical protein
VADWFVSGNPGTTVSAKVSHDRAGTAAASVVLGRSE